MGDESKPLLQNGSDKSGTPIQDYKSRDEGEPKATRQEESSPKAHRTVSCRVCQNTIEVINKPDQHVVKCSTCGEATPIRDPPPGKKYVRCQCNCLLVCSSSAPRIACPRQDCRRIVSLSSTPSGPPIPYIPGMARVICVHCQDTFLFNTLKNMSARCPHCRKMSSVGPEFGRSRGHWYLAGFILFFIVGVSVTGATYQFAKTNSFYIGLYVGCFVISIALLSRSIYFYTMKISSVGGSV